MSEITTFKNREAFLSFLDSIKTAKEDSTRR